MQKYFLIIVFSLAIMLRLLFIPNPGFEADVAFWKGWGLAAADKGVVWAILNTNNNYPTPFAYTLGAMVVVYRLLGGNPYDFNDYWSNTNLRFLIASKIPPILADFGIALLILFVAKKFSKQFNGITNRQAELLAAIYLLNPVSIMDGAWWGQVDSLGVVYFLLVILALLYKRTFLAGLIFMLAMMTKLQNMIYGPVLFVFIWKEFGFKGLIHSIAGSVLGFFGLNIEFFLSKNMNSVVGSLVNNYDYFPYMSLHAYNPWWVASGGNGMGMSDKFLTIGVMTAKSVGTILFSACYLIGVLAVSFPAFKNIFTPYKKHSEETASYFTLFLSLCVINFGFFLFQTQSHERYAFPVFVFSLFLIPFLKGKRRIAFLVSYCLFSVIYFLNLHTAFAFNYPDNVFQSLLFLAAPQPTIIISYLQTFIFILFIIFFIREITFPIAAITTVFCLSLLLLGNLSYLRGKPILLSSMTPIISSQQYGARQKNMPVSGGFGPRSWAWLSTQYAFFRYGIGTHANSEITYDIGRKFREIRTDYGIDTIAGSQASAQFEIWGDGKQLFISPKMGRFDMPKHTIVNLTGVRFLTLKTTDAGDNNHDDHTDWLNTKLFPKL